MKNLNVKNLNVKNLNVKNLNVKNLDVKNLNVKNLNVNNPNVKNLNVKTRLPNSKYFIALLYTHDSKMNKNSFIRKLRASKYVLYFIVLAILLYVSYYLGRQFVGGDVVGEGFEASSPGNTVPEVAFPFKNFRDDKGALINIILISAPFRTDDHEKMYEEYKNKGMHFCGISSYLDFPDYIINPHESRFHEERKHDYYKMVTTWIHCFRNPCPALKNSGLPLLLMSEADLKDHRGYYKPDPAIQKEYDFMYICLDDDDTGKTCKPGWNWYNRNWDLAKKCLVVMCQKFNLKGVIMGRTNCEYTDLCSGIVKTMPFLPFHEFQKEMQKCRFLFAPNISDASPRVLTEALCYNMPILVNENIIGGWHNVVPGVTGEFFTDEFNIIPALEKITRNYATYQARDWYCNNRGQEIAGGQMAQFLKDNYPNMSSPDTKYVTI